MQHYPGTTNLDLVERLVGILGDTFKGWEATIVTEIDRCSFAIQWDSDSGHKHVTITPVLEATESIVYVHGFTGQDADQVAFQYILNWIPGSDVVAQYHMIVQAILSTWVRYVDIGGETPVKMPLNQRDIEYRKELHLRSEFNRPGWEMSSNYYEGGMLIRRNDLEGGNHKQWSYLFVPPPWEAEDDGTLALTFECGTRMGTQERFYRTPWQNTDDIEPWLKMIHRFCDIVDQHPMTVITDDEARSVLGKNMEKVG